MNLDKTTANVVTQFSSILTKECRVVLKTLDASAIAKAIPSTSKIKNAKEDTSNMDSAKDTLSHPSSTDSDESPLSQLFNRDWGRPQRRTKKLNIRNPHPTVTVIVVSRKPQRNASNPIPEWGPQWTDYVHISTRMPQQMPLLLNLFILHPWLHQMSRQYSRTKQQRG